MRFLAFILALAFAPSAMAAEPPEARAAFVERLGMLRLDARCGLLDQDVRAALRASSAQARGALLRAGWTDAQIRNLERTVSSAADERPCNDPRNAEAASDARHAADIWRRTGTMRFPGWEREWVARRTADREGWRLSQSINDTTFGVRERGAGQTLSLVASGEAPSAVRLTMRDARRSRMEEVALTRRVAYGLEAGMPGPRTATISSTAARRSERVSLWRSQTVFEFPNAVFEQLLALDPRETVELELRYGRRSERLLIEVGDLAAARAFLALR